MTQVAEAAAAPAPATVPAAAPAPAATATVPAPTATTGDQAQATTVPGAPEKYADFKVPEGVTLDKAMVVNFQGVAKTHGLTQDQAQALVDFQMSSYVEYQKAQQASLEAFYVAEAAALPGLYAKDPVLGGPNTVENVAASQRGLAALHAETKTQTKELVEAKDTPNAVKVLVARILHDFGKAIKEDSVAGGSDVGGEAKTDYATEFYRKASKPNAPKTA